MIRPMNAPFREKIYITTPLYYVNAKPHIGHAYSTILSDALSVFYRQRGLEVRVLTGTDHHGEKIANIARKENKTPREFSDAVSEQFRSAWQTIGLRPDVFYKTTSPSHYALVTKALQDLKDRGEIYFESYKGKFVPTI